MIVEMYTRLQWLERGRIVKGNAVGQWRWPCHAAHVSGRKTQYFEIGETYYHPARAARKLAAYRRVVLAGRDQRRKEREREEERRRRYDAARRERDRASRTRSWD